MDGNEYIDEYSFFNRSLVGKEPNIVDFIIFVPKQCKNNIDIRIKSHLYISNAEKGIRNNYYYSQSPKKLTSEVKKAKITPFNI